VRAARLAAGLVLAAAGAGAEPPAVVPLIEIGEGRIAACGFLFDVSGAPVAVRLDRGPQGTVLSVSGPGGAPAEAVPAGSGTSAGCAATDPLPATRDGVATLVRALAIRGADLCTRSGEGVVRAHVPGPFPNQARAAFLNCTGDLYRQAR